MKIYKKGNNVENHSQNTPNKMYSQSLLCAQCNANYMRILRPLGMAAAVGSGLAYVAETTVYTTYYTIKDHVLYVLAVNRKHMPENQIELETFEFATMNEQARILQQVVGSPIIQVYGPYRAIAQQKFEFVQCTYESMERLRDSQIKSGSLLDTLNNTFKGAGDVKQRMLIPIEPGSQETLTREWQPSPQEEWKWTDHSLLRIRKLLSILYQNKVK